MTQEHISKLSELKKLVDAGILTQEEMQEEKRKILADNNSVDVIPSNPQTIIRCSACGEEADAELAECPHCHEPLSGKSMEVENTTKPCVVCGEPILSIAEKCKHCGAWQNEVVEEIAPDAVPLTIGSDGHISFERPEEAKTPLEEEKKSDGVNMKTVLIALAVMAIIIIVLLFSKKSNEPSYYDEPQEEVVAVDSAVADAETYYDEGTLDSLRLMREDAIDSDIDMSQFVEDGSEEDYELHNPWSKQYLHDDFGEDVLSQPFIRTFVHGSWNLQIALSLKWGFRFSIHENGEEYCKDIYPPISMTLRTSQGSREIRINDEHVENGCVFVQNKEDVSYIALLLEQGRFQILMKYNMYNEPHQNIWNVDFREGMFVKSVDRMLK